MPSQLFFTFLVFCMFKVITSCNSTKDELIQEVEDFNQRRNGDQDAVFEYIDHIRTYPTFMFGGSVGSRVATVAFLRK